MISTTKIPGKEDMMNLIMPQEFKEIQSRLMNESFKKLCDGDGALQHTITDLV